MKNRITLALIFVLIFLIVSCTPLGKEFFNDALYGDSYIDIMSRIPDTVVVLSCPSDDTTHLDTMKVFTHEASFSTNMNTSIDTLFLYFKYRDTTIRKRAYLGHGNQYRIFENSVMHIVTGVDDTLTTDSTTN